MKDKLLDIVPSRLALAITYFYGLISFIMLVASIIAAYITQYEKLAALLTIKGMLALFLGFAVLLFVNYFIFWLGIYGVVRIYNYLTLRAQ